MQWITQTSLEERKKKKIEKATKSPMYHRCIFHTHIRQDLKFDHIFATTTGINVSLRN